MVKVIVKTNLLGLIICKTEIKRGFTFIFDFLNLHKDVQIDLILCNDNFIKSLNEKFLNCIGPTNVLSFPLGDEFNLGDIVVSIPAVIRESFLYKQERIEHFWRLVCHGILHLLGYEHGPEMFVLTDDMVEKLYLLQNSNDSKYNRQYSL
ncbi:probable rRNA maturation factor [Desulfonauticus submarinus]|uniref:Endoribonuclease YbeY n=1 Tax=Desulfonauticus submarinus TaxID=206665 RepID=A0A1H0B495_9BACT|nr:rRNA maturation RNase YbeY [Desulfonauticus submarinus]SDN40449.1 probable rRNA maturation factor [Desulfonauticus submarinus]